MPFPDASMSTPIEYQGSNTPIRAGVLQPTVGVATR